MPDEAKQTLRERVARTICEALGDDFDREGPGGLLAYDPVADAILEALSHPTEEMVEAGARAIANERTDGWWWLRLAPEDRRLYTEDARACLTAALTAAMGKGIDDAKG